MDHFQVCHLYGHLILATCTEVNTIKIQTMVSKLCAFRLMHRLGRITFFELLKKWASYGIKSKNCTLRYFSGIQTRIIRIKSQHVDHLTTTTSQLFELF